MLLVDQSLSDFFRHRGRNRCRHIIFPILDISIRFRDIRGRSLKLSEITLYKTAVNYHSGRPK